MKTSFFIAGLSKSHHDPVAAGTWLGVDLGPVVSKLNWQCALD